MNNTSAGLPTRLWAERMKNRASISARGRFPSFQKCPDWLWGSFHGGEEAVVCSGELTCTKVKNSWIYTSILTFAFMVPAGDEVTSRQLLRCIIPQAVNIVWCSWRVELIEFTNKLLFLHLVGCLYYCIRDARSHKHQKLLIYIYKTRCSLSIQLNDLAVIHKNEDILFHPYSHPKQSSAWTMQCSLTLQLMQLGLRKINTASTSNWTETVARCKNVSIINMKPFFFPPSPQHVQFNNTVKSLKF